MRVFVTAIFVTVCFIKVCLQSSLKARKGIYIIAVIIVRGSALPAYFYDILDEADDVTPRYEVSRTTGTSEAFKPTTSLTTERPIPDEWRIRGEYRVQCVDEIGVRPQKVVTAISKEVKSWDDDLEMKMWMLCVLNKMGLMSKQGVFKMDVAMSKIYDKDKKEVESLINRCLPKIAMEPYEIAWRYVTCHFSAKGNYSAISVF